jgi:hypothetical protein
VENGRIIALSSSFLAKPFPGYDLYITSKAGVEGQTRRTVMFSTIGITGRVGGGAASRLLAMGKEVRAVVRDEAKQGCHIITEEVVRGEGAIKFRQEQPNAMHDGHDLWLKVIKERSEKQN